MRFLTIVFLLLVAQDLPAQETSPPTTGDMRVFMRSLMNAQMEGIYVVDVTRQSCAKITSGLVQRGVVYFRIDHASAGERFVYDRATHDRSESGEVRKDGSILYRPLLSFDTETEMGAAARILDSCEVDPEPAYLEITNVFHDDGEAVIWEASQASGYCKRPWLNEDCVLGCLEHVDRGVAVLVFAKGQPRADHVMHDAGFIAHCTP